MDWREFSRWFDFKMLKFEGARLPTLFYSISQGSKKTRNLAQKWPNLGSSWSDFDQTTADETYQIMLSALVVLWAIFDAFIVQPHT